MITQHTDNEFDKLAPLEKWLENRMVAEYAVDKEKKKKKKETSLGKTQSSCKQD